MIESLYDHLRFENCPKDPREMYEHLVEQCAVAVQEYTGRHDRRGRLSGEETGDRIATMLREIKAGRPILEDLLDTVADPPDADDVGDVTNMRS